MVEAGCINTIDSVDRIVSMEFVPSTLSIGFVNYSNNEGG